MLMPLSIEEAMVTSLNFLPLVGCVSLILRTSAICDD